MALRSVYQIDINDSAFQKFASQFREYQAILATTPRTWAEATKAMDGSITSYKELVELAKARLLQAKMIGAAEKAASDQIEGPERRREEAAKRQAQAWKDIAKSAHGFAAGVAGATTSLLRWGSLTGLISGILGAGGLLGIDRLAISAGNARRSGLGLGVTPGEQSSFGINLGRVVDPDAVLSGVNEALTDPRKSTPFYALGLNYGAEQKKGAFGASLDVLQAVKRLADATPEGMAGSTYDSRRIGDLGISLDDFLRLKHLRADEIADYVKQAKADRDHLQRTEAQSRAWQDLQVQLTRSKSEIENTFIVGLTPLAPKIEALSSSLTTLVAHLLRQDGPLSHFLDSLADDFGALDKKIGDPNFQANVDKFVVNTGRLAEAALHAAEHLARLVGNNPSTTAAIAGIGAGAEIGSVAGGVIGGLAGVFGGPAGIVAGVAGGSTIGAGVGAVAGGFGADIAMQIHKQNQKYQSKVADTAKNEPLLIQDFAKQAGVPLDFAQSIFAIEGGVNLDGSPRISPRGAIGAGQLMPDTAKYLKVDPYDLKQNIEGSTRYMAELLSDFGGNRDLAAAAYNWGEKHVRDDLAKHGKDWLDFAPRETQAYVRVTRGPGNHANQYAQNFKDRSVTVSVHNNTGGNANVSVLQNGPAS